MGKILTQEIGIHEVAEVYSCGCVKMRDGSWRRHPGLGRCPIHNTSSH